MPGVCKKCLTSKLGSVSCTWAEQKPRRRSSKPSSKARVTELESKLNELLARVDQSQADNDKSELATYEGWVDENPFTNTPFQSGNSYLSVPTTGNIPELDFGFSTSPNLFASYPRISKDQSVPDILLACGMSIAVADGHLFQFRSMSAYFPFVIIPNEATVISMSQDRPFLCLAALSAATSSEKMLQKSLEQRFRVAILEKIMLDGERSLDLLNGLLVYLAWYHFYYIPKREQSYQLIQMAIGMCIDLGLNLRPAEAITRKAGLRLSHYCKADQKFAEHDAFYSREARRAYLGCYYLSTATAWVTGKPSNIHVTNYMYECGASLAQEMEYSTDPSLLPLIQVQRLAEENHKNLCIAKGKIQSPEEVQRVQTHLNGFRIQLDNWKARLSPVLRQSTTMEMACHFARMHTHEMELINPFSMTYGAASTTMSTSEPYSSFIRLDVLLVCLEATKQLCEVFLALPAGEYRRISFLQWSSIIYAIVLLYKLSIGLAQVPEWDVSAARGALSIEMFLETLCSRLDSVSPACEATLERTDLFSMMGAILENVKTTYDRLKKLPQSQSANDANPVHATSFPNTIVSSNSHPKTYEHRCPAYPFWKRQCSNMSLFHEEELPGSISSVDITVGDAFGGFGLVGDDDFLVPAPKAGAVSSGWNFSSY